jgi:hypothetical protein
MSSIITPRALQKERGLQEERMIVSSVSPVDSRAFFHEALLSTVRTPARCDAGATMPHHRLCDGPVRAYLGKGAGADIRGIHDQENPYPHGGACASRR